MSQNIEKQTNNISPNISSGTGLAKSESGNRDSEQTLKASKTPSDKSNSSDEEAPPVPNFITQADPSGKQKTKQEGESLVGKSENTVASGSFCTCLISYLCCIDYTELYETENSRLLLSDQEAELRGKPCLVIDLDETLVHSSFVEVAGTDFKLDIELEGKIFTIYVLVRPGAQEFLQELSEYYELVLFTASVSKYAQKVTERIDPKGLISTQLYREHCTWYHGNYVKDLSKMNRPIEKCIIVDNSHFCYQFQPSNAIGVTSFFEDKNDRELHYCKEFLLSIKDAADLRRELTTYRTFVEGRHRQDLASAAGKSES